MGKHGKSFWTRISVIVLWVAIVVASQASSQEHKVNPSNAVRRSCAAEEKVMNETPKDCQAEDESGWGESVKGLRLRLVVNDRKITDGKLHGLIELQNVGKETMVIYEPRILPQITSDSEGHAKECKSYNTVITARPVNPSPGPIAGHILTCETVPKSISGWVLKPGQRLSVEVQTAKWGENCVEPTTEQRNAEYVPKPDQLGRYVVLNDRVTRLAGYVSGPHRLEITYKSLEPSKYEMLLENPIHNGVEPMKWEGELKCPPVVVEIDQSTHKANDENIKQKAN